MESSPPTRNALINLSVFAFVFIISLYAAELSLGLLLQKNLLNNPLPPNTVQTHTRPEYSVEYRYNNLSLRGIDIDLSKKYSICLIGDSFFFGQGVEEKDTMAAKLAEAGESTINASEIATNPPQYFNKLRILSKLGMKTDHVIIGLFLGNDFQDTEGKDFRRFMELPAGRNPLQYDFISFLSLERIRFFAYSMRSRLRGEPIVRYFSYKKGFTKDWLTWYTNANPSLMAEMASYSAAAKITEDTYFEKSQITTPAISLVAEMILRMTLLLPTSTKTHVMLIPDLHYAKGELSDRYNGTVRTLIASLKNHGRVDIIDMHPVVKPYMYYTHDGHWNTIGHRVATSVILQHIGKQKY